MNRAGLLELPILPQPLVTAMINEELRVQRLQIDYFRTRTKVGPIVVPACFQPNFEPEKGRLLALFTAPGEIHFVFRDEIAPNRIWDEQYRVIRKRSLGRAADIESLEVGENTIRFTWCGVLPLNPYEFGIHPTMETNYAGEVYSSTWNHMLGATPELLITLRGGYTEVIPSVFTGNRDDAENYAKGLEA